MTPEEIEAIRAQMAPEPDPLEAVTALAARFCTDCVEVVRRFNPAEGWEWQLHHCGIDRPIVGPTLDSIRSQLEDP